MSHNTNGGEDRLEKKFGFAGIFTDHAVFQAGKTIPVWGYAPAGTLVECSLNQMSAWVRATEENRFFLRLPPFSHGGPHELTLKDTGTGETRILHDIMIGEVYLASGQSNMQISLRQLGQEAAFSGNIRMYMVPEHADVGGHEDVRGRWRTADETCSAVAFYFAEALAERSPSVTVGIINSYVGGTRIEAWMSRESLMDLPCGRREVAQYEKTAYSKDAWAEDWRRCSTTDEVMQAKLERLYDVNHLPVHGLINGWEKEDFDDSDWKNVVLPSTFRQLGFHANGALWFRKKVNLPSGGGTVAIGKINGESRLFVNGVENGFLKQGENTLAFRIYCIFGDGGFQENRLEIIRGKETIALNGVWRMRLETDLTRTRRQGENEDDTHMMLRFLPYITFATPEGPLRTRMQPSGQGITGTPGILYENMIRPLIPYGIRGAIWYQGEDNTFNAHEYAEMLRAMIRSWRHSWGQGRFPFYIVQLANFGIPEPCNPTSSWALLREAQAMANAAEGDGMVVAIDVGDASNIHPPDKRSVGKRLAGMAEGDEYFETPVPIRHDMENGRVRIRFSHAEGLSGSDGFFLAGPDGNIVPAKVEICASCVQISSQEIPDPAVLYYQWADNPSCKGLKNRYGIPAAPFRIILRQEFPGR